MYRTSRFKILNFKKFQQMCLRFLCNIAAMPCALFSEKSRKYLIANNTKKHSCWLINNDFWTQQTKIRIFTQGLNKSKRMKILLVLLALTPASILPYYYDGTDDVNSHCPSFLIDIRELYPYIIRIRQKMAFQMAKWRILSKPSAARTVRPW